LEEACSDVGSTDSDHFLVASHLLAAAGSEGGRRGHGVRECDHGDGERSDQ
jgi:hypothetical protein